MADGELCTICGRALLLIGPTTFGLHYRCTLCGLETTREINKEEMTDRKFYKKVFHFEVLSETPFTEDEDLQEIIEIIESTINGENSGRTTSDAVVVLNGAEAAAALRAQNSDPGFFSIDDNGKDTD